MRKKILLCATVDYHFKAFHLPMMRWLKEQGWEIDVAASGQIELPYTNKKYNIPIQRSPFHRSNMKAYRQLKSIIETNHYTLIDCHTPLGGVLTRLAAKQARKKGTKVVYTAHGFHFCKGAPIRNWFIYYPIEKYLSRYTDNLLTINTEDYQLAKEKRFKAKTLEHVHGVGIDSDQFKPIMEFKKQQLRESFGYNANDFLLFYAAEFNKNKNQQFLIRALPFVKDEVPNAKLILAGEGRMLDWCRQLAMDLGVSHMVDFLGFRKDIDQLASICDVAVSSSLREGLPVNIMEAMSCGLPVVAVDNRGHRELVKDNKNGWKVAVNDIRKFSEKINMLHKLPELTEKLGSNGRQMIVKTYSTTKVLQEKKKIYQENMKGEEGQNWVIH